MGEVGNRKGMDGKWMNGLMEWRRRSKINQTRKK